MYPLCMLCSTHYKNDVLIWFQALVWDDALTGPFGLIAEYSLLKVGTGN